MRYIIHILTLLLALPTAGFAQHTFSIVAVDVSTGDIGSAGATCLDSVILKGEMGALVISDIIVGRGAIHSQAMWLPENQIAARQRMEAGDSPQKIIDWLILNDSGKDDHAIDDRQYGIVDLHQGGARVAAYTGQKPPQYASHLTGSNYSIQGNILLNEDVLLDMERAFLETDSALADKLMAAMSAAKRIGADSRCKPKDVSSLSAFIRVARPTDNDSGYGKLSLDINIDPTPEGVDPIDLLQESFNDWKKHQSNNH